MQATTIGLDIAKQLFFAVGKDSRGRQVWRKRLRRAQVLAFYAQQAPCLVGLEAGGGAQYWARQLQAHGHAVKVMAPRHVKAFRRGQKNDYNDAGAIGEAAGQPAVRGVPLKSAAQQDLQALHRVRDGLVRQRTAVVNRVRGLLAEQGIVLAVGIGRFRRLLPALVEEQATPALSAVVRRLVGREYERVRALDGDIKDLERELVAASQADAAGQRLQAVPGLGPIGTTALLGAVGDGRAFRSGRELAAWLGLVPRQHTTGGKPRLYGISKRGDKRLRALLIHGARAVVRHAARKADPLSRWIRAVQARRGTNVATVALANKLVRIAWVLLARAEPYAPVRAAA
jgi:transposase